LFSTQSRTEQDLLNPTKIKL